MRAICAYNVNIDAVHEIRGEETSDLVRSLGLEDQAGTRLPDKIASLHDLLSGLLYCMRNGTGAELLVDAQEVARSIEEAFTWEHRLGGNAGNMANALAELGAEPVLNVPSLTPRLASLLSPGVRVPALGGEALLRPKEAVRDEDDPVHFVLQFRKGETVRIPKGQVLSPRENRLIATWDPLNQRLYTDPDFEAYCSLSLAEARGALVSGFHLVPPGHRGIFDEKAEQLRSWREESPGLFVHAEMGSFQRPEMMRYLVERLPVDSLGLNEDELALLERFAPTWDGIMEAAGRLRQSLGIVRISVHTRDFVISVSEGWIDPEQEVDALTFGADVAGALVETGRVTGRPPAKTRSVGACAREEFCREGGVRSGRGAYRLKGREAICLVPALAADSPRITVGIGDALAASTFLREMARLGEVV
jgi:ADP-dependent phosphofructokinase/glucokinase